MNEEDISKKIRVVREENGMTLQELADLSGLTKGYLSKIERSKKAPPFSSLNRIAVALGVEVTDLLRKNGDEIQDERILLTKSGQGQIVKTVGTLYGYSYQALAQHKTGKNMIPYIIEPASEEKGVFSHPGEEFIYVLQGRHELVYDGKKYIMEQGDSAYFDSGVPHSGRSLSGRKTKILAVMYNYKRI